MNQDVKATALRLSIIDDLTWHMPVEQLADLENHGPIPPNGWSFEIGQRVEHIDGGWPATVVGRAASTKRGEFRSEITWIQLDIAPEGTGDLIMMETKSLVRA
jgi:hypothetical protein